ncbi:MAG TPA: lytic transglycosylase domain-containing protein [Candidatus Acidoferrum sp.]|nr:lytic transglycosylase domain-containing protein [Candidatus Acidoferrum sp.]
MGVRRTVIAAAVSLALMCAASAQAQSGGRSRADNDRLFRAAAELYSIDPALLAAIASVESGGNAGAVSPKGAQGLMQLMPATANRFRVLDPFDPVSNTLGAVRFINFLRQYRTAHGDGTPLSLPEMLAAYNAGEGAVDKYNGVPPYPETRQYVRKVLVAYLFGDSRSALAQRLGARKAQPTDRAATPINPKPAAANTQPVVTHQKNPTVDSLDKLAEIQRLRQLEINKQQTASRIGEYDASH